MSALRIFKSIFSFCRSSGTYSRPGKASGSAKRDVDVLEILPIGSYALQINFSDGHDSGIYSYDYLEELGKNKDSLWQAYLEDLKAAGASRDLNNPANKRFEEPPKKKCPSHH